MIRCGWKRVNKSRATSGGVEWQEGEFVQCGVLIKRLADGSVELSQGQ